MPRRNAPVEIGGTGRRPLRRWFGHQHNRHPGLRALECDPRWRSCGHARLWVVTHLVHELGVASAAPFHFRP